MKKICNRTIDELIQYSEDYKFWCGDNDVWDTVSDFQEWLLFYHKIPIDYDVCKKLLNNQMKESA